MNIDMSDRARELLNKVKSLGNSELIEDAEKQELIELYSQMFFEDVEKADVCWKNSDIYMHIISLKQAVEDAAVIIKLITERKSQ